MDWDSVGHGLLDAIFGRGEGELGELGEEITASSELASCDCLRRFPNARLIFCVVEAVEAMIPGWKGCCWIDVEGRGEGLAAILYWEISPRGIELSDCESSRTKRDDFDELKLEDDPIEDEAKAMPRSLFMPFGHHEKCCVYSRRRRG